MTAPIAFRVDATPKVALGHLRRCLALAEALRRKGGDAVFLCFDDPASRDTLSGAGFPCEWLAQEIGAEGDLSDTLARLGRRSPSLVIVDSYAASSNYLDALHATTPTVGMFEDLGRTDYPVELVINGSPLAPPLAYRVPVRLVGPGYMILGPEYWAPPRREVRTRVQRALVTMGGIDHYDLSSRAIRLFDNLMPGLHLDVVIGPYYDNKASVRTAAADATHLAVELHDTPPSLYPLMRHADLAISAGGFTLYELAATGVPTVGMALWDNQRPNVDALGALKIIVPLHYRDGPEMDCALGVALSALAGDAARRRACIEDGQRFIDGQGALRVARTILETIIHRAEAI
jgi:UDP-2,4-diacetamido-2,4,6-trideoxy-beta-L-altropyranose hydrolase